MKKRKEKFVDCAYFIYIYEGEEKKHPKHTVVMAHYRGETKGQFKKRLERGIQEGKVTEYIYKDRIEYSNSYSYEYGGLWAGYTLSDYINIC